MAEIVTVVSLLGLGCLPCTPKYPPKAVSSVPNTWTTIPIHHQPMTLPAALDSKGHPKPPPNPKPGVAPRTATNPVVHALGVSLTPSPPTNPPPPPAAL